MSHEKCPLDLILTGKTNRNEYSPPGMHGERVEKLLRIGLDRIGGGCSGEIMIALYRTNVLDSTYKMSHVSNASPTRCEVQSAVYRKSDVRQLKAGGRSAGVLREGRGLDTAIH